MKEMKSTRQWFVLALVVALIVAVAIDWVAHSSCFAKQEAPIDRQALVTRNFPHINSFDSLSSLSVGNGNFAFTVDATGMQSFPEHYVKGVALGTQSHWGWHSFPNTGGYMPEETFRAYDFRGKEELYAIQFKDRSRNHEASEYFRVNPHRLHLGYVGLVMYDGEGKNVSWQEISNIDQTLDLWAGCISSSFDVDGTKVNVRTACDPDADRVAFHLESDLLAQRRVSVRWSFPYPTGGHVDDASDWTKPQKHRTDIVSQKSGEVLLKRTLDETVYYVKISWKGDAVFDRLKEPHAFSLIACNGSSLDFTTEYLSALPQEETSADARAVFEASAEHWAQFWQTGGAVDFSECTDPRAPELERRVVLSEYLLAIQCAGIYPPQETGLTFNSWYGKYHLEMHWWHEAQFALWQRDELLEPSLEWYFSAADYARSIARRQGFEGIRWMKMTDPSAIEAPSSVGSFLLWQQPHLIYMAELLRRNQEDGQAVVEKYKDLVFQSADFIASFVDYDGMGDRYIIQGLIPAQETLKASETINPPFELSYVHFALKTAQHWRELCGMQRNMNWETILDKLSPLAYNEDKLYLAAETATDTYVDIRYTSDHPAILGALGVLPNNSLIRKDIMGNTFDWIWDNWNWGKTWGWDYPMTAMCAARLGRPEQAVGALLMDRRTNTYLPNGHNYQDARLRIYLPGNGGLLTAVAMMCAGWDEVNSKHRQNVAAETPVTHVGGPGFPDDGTWNVRWENLSPMP